MVIFFIGRTVAEAEAIFGLGLDSVILLRDKLRPSARSLLRLAAHFLSRRLWSEYLLFGCFPSRRHSRFLSLSLTERPLIFRGFPSLPSRRRTRKTLVSHLRLNNLASDLYFAVSVSDLELDSAEYSPSDIILGEQMATATTQSNSQFVEQPQTQSSQIKRKPVPLHSEDSARLEGGSIGLRLKRLLISDASKESTDETFKHVETGQASLAPARQPDRTGNGWVQVVASFFPYMNSWCVRNFIQPIQDLCAALFVFNTNPFLTTQQGPAQLVRRLPNVLHNHPPSP